MKLHEYLMTYQMSPAEFAKQLGVGSRMTVHRYLRGTRMPSPEIMRRIVDVTGGRVQPNDFYDVDPAAVPRVLTDPWRESSKVKDTFAFLDPIMRRAVVSRPVAYAIHVLGPRARAMPRGMLFVDNRRVDTRDVIRAANEILAAAGQPIIAYPGVHDPANSDRPVEWFNGPSGPDDGDDPDDQEDDDA